ncbi:putative carotenoid oxygenase [Helianthus annuus]|nr:putative carotenoid oxygenase [Helianthus annuus]
MRFNMESGIASQKKLSESAVDFPKVNQFYTGRKQRYVYATKLDNIGKVTAIVKFDLHAEPETGKTKIETGGNIQGIYELGLGIFGSEAIFVPNQPGRDSEEDDGYLIFFTHDESKRYLYSFYFSRYDIYVIFVYRKSSVTIIDAKTMSPNPVAVIPLPHRVPYGFHAFFVTEEQIQEQSKL